MSNVPMITMAAGGGFPGTRVAVNCSVCQLMHSGVNIAATAIAATVVTMRARGLSAGGGASGPRRARRMALTVPWQTAPIAYPVMQTKVLAITWVAFGRGSSEGVIEAM